MAGKAPQKSFVMIVGGIALLLFPGANFIKTIPVGRVGVATLFGNAQAYEITQINNAIARNQAYIQLQSLEALKAISKDPASKVYFLDG